MNMNQTTMTDGFTVNSLNLTGKRQQMQDGILLNEGFDSSAFRDVGYSPSEQASDVMWRAGTGLTKDQVLEYFTQCQQSDRYDCLNVLRTMLNLPISGSTVSNTVGPERIGFDIRRGLVPASAVPQAREVERLWFGIYSGHVTLLNGETGAGKSVVLLNIAVHGALDTPLWGQEFGKGRCLRVLYVDPENAGGLPYGNGGIIANRLDRLGMGRPSGLFFHSGEGLNLCEPGHVEQLTSLVKEKEIDLLILDPYANLFAMENENDNRQAYENMNALTKMSRATGCAVVLCHHTGKISEERGGGSNKFGRGASSLLGAADVGMTLQVHADRTRQTSDEEGAEESQYRSDVCRLKVEKNRLVGKNTSLYLQMMGKEQFRRVKKADYDANTRKEKEATGPDKPQLVRDCIKQMLSERTQCSRTDMLKAASTLGIGKEIVDAVLGQMKAEDFVCLKKGPRGCDLYTLNSQGSSFQFLDPPIESSETGNWQDEGIERVVPDSIFATLENMPGYAPYEPDEQDTKYSSVIGR